MEENKLPAYVRDGVNLFKPYVKYVGKCYCGGIVYKWDDKENGSEFCHGCKTPKVRLTIK